jgi:hypothetical protein
MGFWVHIDTFAHNKSGIAYQDKSQGQTPLIIEKRNPTGSQGCHQTLPYKPWKHAALSGVESTVQR